MCWRSIRWNLCSFKNLPFDKKLDLWQVLGNQKINRETKTCPIAK